MSSYTVTFSSRRLISRFDDAGNKISDGVELKPVKLTGLPYSTAVSYKDQLNFEFELERSEPQKHLPRPNSGSFNRVLSKARKATKPAKRASPGLHHAAATGDLGHALRIE